LRMRGRTLLRSSDCCGVMSVWSPPFVSVEFFPFRTQPHGPLCAHRHVSPEVERQSSPTLTRPHRSACQPKSASTRINIPYPVPWLQSKPNAGWRSSRIFAFLQAHSRHGRHFDATNEGAGTRLKAPTPPPAPRRQTRGTDRTDRARSQTGCAQRTAGSLSKKSRAS